MIDVSIVIVNWNTSQLLFQCLDSVYRTGSKYGFEVIVVDNGSTDGSPAMVTERFPQVILIQNEKNLGFARANNQGLSIGRGRYHLLLNSDTIMLPDCLDRLVDCADCDPKVGVIGPTLLNMDGSVQISWGRFPSILSELLGTYFISRTPVAGKPDVYEVDWVQGACMLVRSETVAQVGRLDDAYFFYSEEIDWCFRIKKKEWKIWCLTNAKLYHLGGGSTQAGSLAQFVRLYRGKLLYFQKHHGLFKSTLLRLGLALANSFGVLRRVLSLRWMRESSVSQRIINQSKLVWCLLINRYPAAD